MVYMKKGTRPLEMGNNSLQRYGVTCAHCGEDTAVGMPNQGVVSKTTD